MSRSSTSDRGQTEPLAALVAVSALIAGIGLYGLYLTDTLPGTTDRTTETTALERIADDLESDGVVRAYGDDLATDIETGTLPHGRNVYVRLTIVADGRKTVVGTAVFGTDGTSNSDSIDGAELDGPPDEAGVAERSVAVATAPGDVRRGTLLVGVWNG